MDLLKNPLRACMAAALGAWLAAGTSFAVAAPEIIVKYFPMDQPGYTGDLMLGVSADGRYIMHRTGNDAGLVGNIMVYDVLTGTRVQANQTVTGGLPTGAVCDTPAMSADAHYVVFGCLPAAQGVTVTGNAWRYFVYDRLANKTELLPLFGSERVYRSQMPAISKDGQYLAYRGSDASGSVFTLYLRNMVSKSTQATNADHQWGGFSPAALNISDDGRYAGYLGRMIISSVVSDAWFYDRVGGVSEAANVNAAGVKGSQGVVSPTMSADGSAMVFLATDQSLVSPPLSTTGVYVRDRVAHTTELVSARTLGIFSPPALSANGRYIAYTANPSSSVKNLYVYDRLTKITRIVPGAITNAQTVAYAPAFSADGRYLVFRVAALPSGSSVSIGYADLGAAAGLTLSPAPSSLTEGGAAGTYSVALTRIPDADVTVTVTPDKQMTVARTQLTFTRANWNVPQLVSAQAIQDNVAEGLHSGKITHTLTSTDIEYTVVPPVSVTIPIADAVIPTVALPAQSWGQPDLPLTGKASPGETVLVTSTNRTTGALVSVSTVTDAQGGWNCVLRGLSQGLIDIDAQADGITGAVVTIAVDLSQP